MACPPARPSLSCLQVQIYNIDRDRWTLGADMPYEVGSAATAFIGDKVGAAQEAWFGRRLGWCVMCERGAPRPMLSEL